MNEYVALLAIVASISGAGLSTVRAYLEAPESEGYSKKKLFGALVGAVLFAFTTVNLVSLPEQLSTTGLVGVFVLNAVAGSGIASILHRSNK